MKLRLLALALCLAAAPAAAQVWVDGGGRSCDAACGASGMAPVVSGTNPNGQPYYACAANARGEGYRAGYNLRPSWANSCTVGSGGQELSVPAYSCLCAPGAGPKTGYSSNQDDFLSGGASTTFFEDEEDEEIDVLEATLGANCGLPQGNATANVTRHCEGYPRCDYIVDRFALGGGNNSACVEDFSVRFRCGNGAVQALGANSTETQVVIPIVCGD